MPYTIRKLNNLNLYSIKNPLTGKFQSYGSTLPKVRAKLRLLMYLEHKKYKPKH
jgi:hypothetical protein